MKDWMTIAISFLGGLAVALIAFLVFQPPGASKGNSASNGTDAVSSADTSSNDPSPRANKEERQNQKDWSGEVSEGDIPRLLFYSIPT